jgi:hypothetical protein
VSRAATIDDHVVVLTGPDDLTSCKAIANNAAAEAVGP